MIDRIIEFSIRQRFLVLMAVFGLIFGGIFALKNLSIDAVPDVTNVQVQVMTYSPALAPLEVEKLITFPIEVALAGLPRVQEVRSLSKFGLSIITVVFDDNVNIYFARQLVQERLLVAAENIPEGIGKPAMGPISTGLGEIFQYAIEDPTRSDMENRTIHDWVVRKQLLTVRGVAEVNTFGGHEKQYEVLVDPIKLQSYRLTLRNLFQAVSENNANVGGAYIEHGPEQYLIRGIGLAATTQDIENIILKRTEGGTPLYLRDLAEVTFGSAIRQGAVTQDGRGEIVSGIVMMLKDENSRIVVERVKKRINEIQASLPEGMKIKPFYDRTELVQRTIRTVRNNLLEGGVLVILVLLVFLGNLRGALLVASIIPLSMLFAVIAMTIGGVSGNLMSLGAIDFGMIVDGAIVLVENTVRRLSLLSEKKEHHEQIIRSSAVEVGRPIVFAVGIIIIVYFPIFTLTGMEGKLFRPMAFVVSFALLGSLILALTYVPAVSTWILKTHGEEKENWLLSWLKPRYRLILEHVIRKPKVVILAALSLVVLSFVIFPFLGSVFIPTLDEGAIALQAARLPSVSLSESVRTSAMIEKVIRQFPEVLTVVSKTGRAEIATDPMGVDMSDIIVMLKPQKHWKVKSKEELVEKMAKALSQVPGIAFSFSQPIQLRVSELIAGVRTDIAIKIFGDDLETLKKRADEIARLVSKIRGAADVKVEPVTGLPQLQVKMDRDLLARYGVNVSEVNDVIETVVGGKELGQVFEGEKRFDLVARFKPPFGRTPEDIKNLLIPTESGATVPLSQLAQVIVEEGPAQISREQGSRRVVIECNVRGRDIGSFVGDAREKILTSVKLPEGYYLTFGGQFEQLEQAQARLMVVVPVAMLLIFILLFMTFGSIHQAVLIYTGIPFAIVGGVFSLALRGLPFSISAGVGFIALFGVAVLNGVVMLSYMNQLREKGQALFNAVLEGAETRLRPVLMTALVASLGFVPMAISHGAGAEVQRPLATVVIGGLVTSTALTLILLPLLYLWVEGWIERRKGNSEL